MATLKGYSPCKILNLSQKIKLAKTCQTRFQKHIRVVLCKRTAGKKQLIVEKREHFGNGQKWPQCKGYSPCEILILGQKVKLPKAGEKAVNKHIEILLCKKQLEKTAIIRKIKAF